VRKVKVRTHEGMVTAATGNRVLYQKPGSRCSRKQEGRRYSRRYSRLFNCSSSALLVGGRALDREERVAWRNTTTHDAPTSRDKGQGADIGSLSRPRGGRAANNGNRPKASAVDQPGISIASVLNTTRCCVLFLEETGCSGDQRTHQAECCETLL